MGQTTFNLAGSERVQPRVLVVQPNRHYLAVLTRRIANAGYRIATAESAHAAFAEIHRMPPDAVVSELAMKGTSGIELAYMMRENAVHRDLPLILTAGRGDSALAIRALQAGADDVVRKPFDIDVLIARIGRQIARAEAFHRLRSDNAVLDARVVERAISLGELRDRLEASEAERRRLEQAMLKSA